GALIENVTIRHSDGSEDILDEEVIIYTGLSLEHAEGDDDDGDDDEDDETSADILNTMSVKQQNVLHYMVAQAAAGKEVLSQSADEDVSTVKKFYDELTDEQKQILHTMVTGDDDDDTKGADADKNGDDDDDKGDGSDSGA